MAPRAVTEGTVKCARIRGKTYTEPKDFIWLFRRRRSVDFGAGGFDNRRPFRKLGLYKVRRRLRRTAWGRIDPGLFQCRGDCGIGKRFVDGCVELVDDWLWCTGRSEQHVPGIAFKSRQTLLLQRRQIRH